MPTLKYRDPADGEFKPLIGGSSGGETTPVGGTVPIGGIISFGGSTPPSGWWLCDGTAHGSPELEAVIGSPNTPDLRGRFIAGAGGALATGSAGGAETHAHSLPEHVHRTPYPLWSNPSGSAGPHSSAPWNSPVYGIAYETIQYPNQGLAGAFVGDGNALTGHPMLTSGSSNLGVNADTNMPPYYVMTYIIRIA